MNKQSLQRKLTDHILSDVLLSKKWNGLSFMDIANSFCEALFRLGYESAEFDMTEKKLRPIAKRG